MVKIFVNKNTTSHGESAYALEVEVNLWLTENLPDGHYDTYVTSVGHKDCMRLAIVIDYDAEDAAIPDIQKRRKE